MPDVSSLVKKTDCNSKILDIEKKVFDHNHNKYITTSEFNNLTSKNFTARLAQENLVTKTDIDANLKASLKTLTQTKQSICLLKMI